MPKSPPLCCAPFCLAGVLALSATLWAGCSSDRGPRYGVASGDRNAAPPAPPPEMEAHGAFFAGQIEVDVVLNRAGFGPRGERGGGGGEGGSGGTRGGFGGGFGGGRGRHGNREGGERSGGDNEGGAPAVHIVASNQPPVALHLRLTSHETAPVEIEVPDFDSDLGNFVVQPDKITVPANGSAEADPMTSRLGVAAAEIPLTVTLRANGQTDHQVLTLHIKPGTAVPDAAVPPASPPP